VKFQLTWRDGISFDIHSVDSHVHVHPTDDDKEIEEKVSEKVVELNLEGNKEILEKL
jgi:hypothetical protein